jgi:hypothetical protein
MNTPQKKLLPEGLMAQLHGKGSMSEVLRIERQRLMEQAAEEMRVQLGAPSVKTAAAAAVTVLEAPTPDTYQPSKLPVVRRSQEGLCKQSRFVGEDLSEFDGIITHSEQSIATPPEWPIDSYYVDVYNTLPFSSQRDLLGAICRLTVGCGSFGCRITLGMLSAASGIRNAKTLRKWLSDLQKKRHIRYVPIHGDLRGSVIELTPPEEVRNSIERNWRNSRLKF